MDLYYVLQWKFGGGGGGGGGGGEAGSFGSELVSNQAAAYNEGVMFTTKHLPKMSSVQSLWKSIWRSPMSFRVLLMWWRASWSNNFWGHVRHIPL